MSATDQTAKCTTSSLVAFPDLIVVNYVSGDFNFNNVNNAAPITQTVNKDATAIAVISSASTTAVVNQTVTFTATITPSAPGVASPASVPITGSVTFTQGGTPVCNPVFKSNADGTGTASCSVAFTGNFPSTPIVAVYNGDTNFSTSNSSVNQTVSAEPTTTTVASQKNPSQVNEQVTLTATVTFTASSGATFSPVTAAPPSGTVSFSDSLDVAGSPFCVTTITNGAPSPVTCLNHPFLTAGNHVITATYSGDSNFATSTSTVITQQVNASGTTGIQVGTTTPTLTVDQSATFTAVFTPPILTGTQPAGTVSYFDSLVGLSAIPTCANLAVTAAGTIPDCVETMLVAGTHNISAAFTPQAGNSNFQINPSPIFAQSVAQNATTVNLTSPTAPSVVDQVVTFAATVTQGTLTPPGTGTTTPSGTISFTSTGSATPICSATVLPATGVATCTAPFTAVGTYNVTATYSGDTNFKVSASTPPFPEVVVKASTSVGLSGATLSTPASPAVNQSATYSVLISVAAPAIDTAAGSAVPAGTVTFNYVLNGGASTLLCSGPVLTTSGVSSASCTTPLGAAGAYTITANYNGDANFAISTTTFPQTIGLSTTTTSITSVIPTNTPAVNALVSLNATVTPTNAGSTIPSGTVTFTDSNPPNADGTCVSTLALDGSVPPCPYSFTTSGIHMLTAKYSGDTKGFSTSTSAPFSVTVGTAGALNVVVGTTTPTVIVNQTATLTASFSPQPTGTQPSGTVSYFDSVLVTVTPTPPGVTPNPTGAIPNCSGLAVTTTSPATIPNCVETMLVAGTHNITATYSGDGNFIGINSLAFPQSVAQNTTTATVTSPASPSVADQPLTYTATVTPGVLAPPPASGTNPTPTLPTGTVAFTYTLNGVTTPICSPTVTTTGGVTQATCTTPLSAPLTTPGNYTVTATYLGDTNFQASAPATSPLVVNQASVTVVSSATTPPSPAVNQPATYSVLISPVAPANDTLAGSVPPTGTVTFNYVLNGGASTLLCSGPVSTTGGVTSANCPATLSVAGTYAMTATYNGDTSFSGKAINFSQTIGASATTMTQPTVAPSGNPTVNLGVTLSATLNFATTGTATPTGTVTFTDTLGGNVVGTCPSILAAGIAPPCQYTFTLAGNHTLTASYPGDNNFGPSSASTPVTVNPAATTSIVVGTATPSVVVNQSAILTAAFTPKITGATQPQGTVAYFDSALVGTGNSTGAITGCTTLAVVNNTPPNPPTIPNCTERMLVSTFSAPHNITAVFTSSNTNFAGIVSLPFPQNVTQEGTKVGVVTAAPNLPALSLAVGVPATYSVQISPAPVSGTIDTGTTPPTGNVTFTDPADTSIKCVASLTTADNGLATCSPVTETTQGPHTIYVNYAGDTNFSKSENLTGIVTIGAATPHVGLTSPSAPNPPVTGNPTSIATQTVTFTATATGPGAPPSGDFVFTTQAVLTTQAPPPPCVAQLQSVGGTQSCVMTFPPNVSSNVSGDYTVTATYNVDKLDPNYSQAAQSITQTILNFTPAMLVNGNSFVVPPTAASSLTLAQATAIVGPSNSFKQFSNTSLGDGFIPLQTTVATLSWTPLIPLTSESASVTACTVYVTPTPPALPTVPVQGITCVPNNPDPSKISTGVLVTTTATNSATTTTQAGDYVAVVTVEDFSNTALFHTAQMNVTVIARPTTLFVGSVGSNSTTFILPPTLAKSSSTLTCDSSNVLTAAADGTYAPAAGHSTFAQIGIACLVSGPDATGAYKVTITAGQGTAKLEIGNSAVIAATLGAPFLLLFGLLPAFRKQRKLLVRSLGMFLMAIAILQTTGCGGGSFLNPNQNNPSAFTGSYLIHIVNSAGATVAEIPVFISNATTTN
ncbi:MAG TPA: Ig-like domain repeat protein [Acidobacteriaceae bacterium]|nr:Ig-like domain repeat protein [Acidobacteriaceae bacterium]